jgi:hypothetical protein
MLKVLLLIVLVTSFAFADEDDSEEFIIDFEYSAFANSYNNDMIDGEKYSKYEFFNILKMKNKTNLTDDIQVDTTVIAMYLTENDNQRGVITPPNNDDNDVRYIDISKLYLTYFLDDMDLYLGKKIKKIGLSEIYSPSDIFGKSIVTPPQHPTEMGAFMLGADYYIEDDTLSFNIFPTNTNYGMPDRYSRWLQGGDYNFYSIDNDAMPIDEDAIIRNEDINSNIRNWAFLLQYSGMLDSLEYYTYISRKKSLYPVLEQKSILLYEKVYPVSTYMAAGLLSVVKENKFYLDVLYKDTLNDMDQDYIKYNLGMKHRQTEYASKFNLDEIALIFEYSNEIITNKSISSSVYQDSEYARINKNNITFSSHFIKDSQLSFLYLVNYSIDEYDSFQNFTFQYNHTDNQTFYISYFAYNGSRNTHFGRWKKNDNLEVGFKYKF